MSMTEALFILLLRKSVLFLIDDIVVLKKLFSCIQDYFICTLSSVG